MKNKLSIYSESRYKKEVMSVTAEISIAAATTPHSGHRTAFRFRGPRL